MKLSKRTIYISLFSILYLIVAGSSFWHGLDFFGLANNDWMSLILSFAFEIGQAAVLFSLLTSSKDRSRIMPWLLMFMFTLVQVIGNVYSSYKYIITHSVDNLRYFKEPIFIWTDLPDDQATVIIVYIVGAILPLCALFLTSMITNYLEDTKEEEIKDQKTKDLNEPLENDINQTKEIHSSVTEGIEEKNDESDKDAIENTTEEIDFGEGSTDGIQLPDTSEEANDNAEDKDDDTEEHTEIIDEVKDKTLEEDPQPTERQKSHFINL